MESAMKHLSYITLFYNFTECFPPQLMRMIKFLLEKWHTITLFFHTRICEIKGTVTELIYTKFSRYENRISSSDCHHLYHQIRQTFYNIPNLFFLSVKYLMKTFQASSNYIISHPLFEFLTCSACHQSAQSGSPIRMRFFP